MAALFALWELASRLGWLPPDILAGPSTVLTAGWDLARDGTLGEALGASVTARGLGPGIGIPLGTALALVAGLSRVGDDLVDANLQMLRFVPDHRPAAAADRVAGRGRDHEGDDDRAGRRLPHLREHQRGDPVDRPGLLELAGVVGLGAAARIRRVVLPGARAGFLVGLRLATGVAWLLLVFAEQINASSGIGYLMVRAQTFFQTDVIVVVPRDLRRPRPAVRRRRAGPRAEVAAVAAGTLTPVTDTSSTGPRPRGSPSPSRA